MGDDSGDDDYEESPAAASARRRAEAKALREAAAASEADEFEEAAEAAAAAVEERKAAEVKEKKDKAAALAAVAELDDLMDGPVTPAKKSGGEGKAMPKWKVKKAERKAQSEAADAGVPFEKYVRDTCPELAVALGLMKDDAVDEVAEVASTEKDKKKRKKVEKKVASFAQTAAAAAADTIVYEEPELPTKPKKSSKSKNKKETEIRNQNDEVTENAPKIKGADGGPLIVDDEDDEDDEVNSPGKIYSWERGSTREKKKLMDARRVELLARDLDSVRSNPSFLSLSSRHPSCSEDGWRTQPY